MYWIRKPEVVEQGLASLVFVGEENSVIRWREGVLIFGVWLGSGIGSSCVESRCHSLISTILLVEIRADKVSLLHGLLSF